MHIKNSIERLFTGSILLVLWLTVLIFQGCSTTKSLGKNELLYKGADINITDKGFLEKMGMKNQLKNYAKPEPNSEFLGVIPFGLWFYNMAGDSVADKGFRHWLKYKLGDQPVIFKYYYVERSENDMQNYLYSKGYFDSRITTKRDISGKKITINYNVEAKQQYLIKDVSYPSKEEAEKGDSLIYLIDSLQTGSLIKPGNHYDFDVLKQERQRINEYLRNNGYYSFAPDYLIFRLDSNYAAKTLDIQLDLKKDVPSDVRRKYYLKKIRVNADYSLENNQQQPDTITKNGYTYVFHEQFIRPGVLSDAILLKKNQPYSFSDYSSTLNKIMGLGVYKFANIRYDRAGQAADSAWLNADLFLTRDVPKSLRFEVQAVTKSNDFTGPGVNFSYQDRNIFHGAESFNLSLNSSFETQIATKNNGQNSWQAGVNAGLKMPRFIFPFIDINNFLAKKYTPHTTINAGYNFYNRTTFFTMNSADFTYGYNWRETISKSHDFQLFNLEYSRLSNTSASFDSILNTNPLVRESFNEQFIVSLGYTYTYNNQLAGEKLLNTFFQFSSELAGNTINLFQRITSQGTAGEKNSKFLGLPYSQYFRGSVDFRLYLNSQKYDKLVNRWFLGVGIPYGNSNTLPYRRQFYIGGPNSIRAFRYRSVGPGSFYPDSSSAGFYFDQTGDVKAEANLEYRFTIYRLVKGALFLDAGNIWLLHSDPQKPGGQFKWDRLFNDLAMGTGFGLRFDASFFVLRLDLGIPLRKPWLPAGQKWSIRQFDLTSPVWRRNNLILNVAIGYPF